jgi:IclR family transcriptional regulator, acetate operon repressor
VVTATNPIRQAAAPADRIQSLSRGLRVLEYVHAAGRPVGVKEVAAGLELHLATTYHLVNTLLHEGYLVRDGRRLLRPGRLPGNSDRHDTLPLQRALGRAAYAVDDVAVLARLAGAETRVTAAAEVPGAACGGHYAPDAADLSHLLAVGRVILAFQAPDIAEQTIELTRRVAAERCELFDEAELRDSLGATAERGFCALVGEGDACVGVPVFSRDGEVLNAVAVVVPPRRLQRALDQLVATATVAAREISRALEAVQTFEPTKEETCTRKTARSTSSSTATSTSGTPAPRTG